MPANPRRDSIDNEVRGALASRVGIAADASADDFVAAFDKRMHEERLHGMIAAKLGLDPSSASGADVLAAVDERIAAKAKRAADAVQSTAPTPAAASSSAVERTLAEVLERLPSPMTAEEREMAEEDAAVDLMLRHPGAGSSNGRDEWKSS